MSVNIDNALLLSNYNMYLDNTKLQKTNRGQLLGINKKTGSMTLLDASLFTKANFVKKFFGRGPLGDYRVSLDSIRKCVKEIHRKEVEKVPEDLRANLLDNISYIFDKHTNYNKDIINFLTTATSVAFNIKIDQKSTSGNLAQPKTDEIVINSEVHIGGYGIKKRSEEGQASIKSEICKSIHDVLIKNTGYEIRMWTGELRTIQELYDEISQAIEINYETKEVTLNDFRFNQTINGDLHFEFSTRE